jgi:hypothetical protein
MAVDRGPELGEILKSICRNRANIAVAAVLGFFLGLAWLFVSLRVYVKTFLNKSWGTDDYLLLVSLVRLTFPAFDSWIKASDMLSPRFSSQHTVHAPHLESTMEQVATWMTSLPKISPEHSTSGGSASSSTPSPQSSSASPSPSSSSAFASSLSNAGSSTAP